MELPNPNRIDLEDPAAVMLWADMLSITPDRLVEIVRKVGPMSASVRFYATKLGTERGAGKAAPAPAGKIEAFAAEQAMA